MSWSSWTIRPLARFLLEKFLQRPLARFPPKLHLTVTRRNNPAQRRHSQAPSLALSNRKLVQAQAHQQRSHQPTPKRRVLSVASPNLPKLRHEAKHPREASQRKTKQQRGKAVANNCKKVVARWWPMVAPSALCKNYAIMWRASWLGKNQSRWWATSSRRTGPECLEENCAVRANAAKNLARLARDYWKRMDKSLNKDLFAEDMEELQGIEIAAVALQSLLTIICCQGLRRVCTQHRAFPKWAFGNPVSAPIRIGQSFAALLVRRVRKVLRAVLADSSRHGPFGRKPGKREGGSSRGGRSRKPSSVVLERNHTNGCPIPGCGRWQQGSSARVWKHLQSSQSHLRRTFHELPGSQPPGSLWVGLRPC